MSDTSLIFNLIARDSGLGRTLGAVAGAFRSAGRDAEEALAQAGSGTDKLDTQIAEVQEHLHGLNREFAATGDTTLFGKMSRDRALIGQLQRVRKELADVDRQSRDTDTAATGLSGMFARAGSAAAGMASQLFSSGGGLAGMVPPMGQVAMLAGQVAGGMLAAGPAIGVFGGMAAALPGMLSGAIAAIATLRLGLFGLGENWKAMNTHTGGGGGGGGGGAAQDMTPKLRAVEAAQRAVTRSTRDVADAQTALREATAGVNDARVQEKERIEDVRRSLASARADEEESVQSLAEARMQLSLAEARGNPDEIRRAQIAVDKQAASLAEAKDKTQDLQKESDDAARKGVEGSDAVVAAKKRESDAQRRVQDAVEQHRLAIQQLGDAQKALKAKMDAAGGSAGGLAAQIPKISRSAQEFLNVLKSLQPAFEDLRLDVQERLFAGLGDKLRVLADVWIPQLKISLGGMADTINGVVKTAFDSLSAPSFVTNMATAFEGFRGMLGKIGQAIAGPLVDAWGRLSAASLPFMDMLGDKISGVVTRFSDWIARMDDSGQLDAFMQKATTLTGHVLDIFEDLARIAGSVISILFGSNLGSTDAWGNLADGVDRVADFMGDPENQSRIRGFLDTLGGGIFAVMGVIERADVWFRRIQGWGAAIGDAYTAVSTFFTHLPEITGAAFTWIGQQIAAFPALAGRWLSTLPGVVGGWLIEAVRQIGYWIGYGIGWAIRAFATMPARVGAALRSLPTVIAGAVRNAAAWLSTLGPRAYYAVRNLAANVRSGVSGLPGLLWSIGRNAVLGLWNGIQSLAGWLWNVSYNFASSIWRGMKSALGIASPSRVMAAEVGQWIPRGIAAGIDANAGSVTAAANRIAQGLAGTRMRVGGLDMGQLDQAVLAATGTVNLAAAQRKPIEVRAVLEVEGDGAFATMVRKSVRTTNLNQKKG